MSPRLPEQDELTPGLERIVFFSDAVFAIAMTLLVIDLDVPGVLTPDTNQAVIDALGNVLPKVLTYALSFAVIGSYWIAHWRRFHYITRADERLALLNLLLLGFVALMPWPTAVLGAHGNQPAAMVLYVAVLSCAGMVGAASWFYAHRAGLAKPGISVTDYRLGLYRGLIAPVILIASLALLPLGTSTVETSWLLIFPAQAVLRRFR